MKLEQEDKYYYFPTMTNKIALTRNEKYIIKGKIYKLFDFTNNSWSSPITFVDDSENMLQLSAWEIGLVISLKKQRKNKLKKLNDQKS